MTLDDLDIDTLFELATFAAAPNFSVSMRWYAVSAADGTVPGWEVGLAARAAGFSARPFPGCRVVGFETPGEALRELVGMLLKTGAAERAVT